MSTLYGHKKSVRALCSDPDGKKILSASSDLILAWEMPLGDIIQEIPAHDIAVNSITSNQYGVVVAGGKDLFISSNIYYKIVLYSDLCSYKFSQF